MALSLAVGACLLPWHPYQVANAKSTDVNFTGEWKLSKEKSDFGGYAAPDSVEKKIEQDEPMIKVHSTQIQKGKTATTDLLFWTNDVDTRNFVNERNAYVTAEWVDTNLHVHTNMQDEVGRPVVMDETWTMSEDKQSLTESMEITTLRKGLLRMKLVFVKKK